LLEACQSAWLCSTVSQLPRRTPRILTPLLGESQRPNRSSGGLSPLPHRRGAGQPRRRLMAPGASWRASR
jgi:hypothetical protein